MGDRFWFVRAASMVAHKWAPACKIRRQTMNITWSDFEKVLIVAGTVTRVEPFPEARKPAWKVWVDFGPYGQKKTSAQIATLYAAEDLVGQQVVGVINLPEKQIGPFRSQFLLTGFHTNDGIVVATVERPVPDGTRMT